MGVDLKPLSAGMESVFTITVGTFALTSLADFGLSAYEVPRAVINRRNYQLTFAIREAIFLVSDDDN